MISKFGDIIFGEDIDFSNTDKTIDGIDSALVKAVQTCFVNVKELTQNQAVYFIKKHPE